MEEKTLIALKGSIKKWKDIVEGAGGDMGGQNCPLCVQFYDQVEETDEGRVRNCVGCPVKEKTGEGCCDNTPYLKWHEKVVRPRNISWTEFFATGIKATNEEEKLVAQEELDFLISLLPEGEKPE